MITSCNTIKVLFDLIRSYYIKYIDIYNAYKHGYRVIPTILNSSREAILFVNDNGEPIVLELNLKDIDKIFELSNYCRSLLENIFENHKLAMKISYSEDKNINLKIYRKKQDFLKQISLNLIYPTREDKLKSIREEEKKVLQKICDIEKYSGNYILLDLDNEKIIFADRNRQKVIEHYHTLEKHNRNVITRLTEKYIQELNLGKGNSA